ncbi:hypothetical protein R1sor_021125 [Riccia sorocarpa]|uniref:SAM-dependent methyltransferase TRM5/TYW2-type domain-containing protein n=1 Tax=Riccia sorocarpa TaxID=122646 RepID=A0ABD3GLV4_9MARC
MVAEKEFELRKQAVLKALASEEVDKSRKGGVDVQIAELINKINSHPHYYTTSSCSGRISLFLDHPQLPTPSADAFHEEYEHDLGEDGTKETEKKRKGGDWIFVSHEPAVVSEIRRSVREKYTSEQKGLLVFRFEPFILALECSSLDSSQQLVSCALASGFRESGITSAGKRCIVAIRCSIRLEVPIADDGQVLVTEKYLEYLVNLANRKMVLNQQRVDRFLAAFTLTFENGLSRPLVQFAADGRKAVRKRRQKISTEVQEKLFLSLEKRQSGILSRTNLLEDKVREFSSPRAPQTASKSETSSGQQISRTAHSGVIESSKLLVSTRLPRLRAVGFIVSGEPVEKLYRWGHSTCILDGTEELRATQSNSVIIYGGYGGPERHKRLNDLLMLNVDEGILRSMQTVGAPAPVMAHTASRVSELMVVIGGRRDPSCILNTVTALDLKSFEWKSPDINGDEFSPRHRHAAVTVGSKIYIFGGLRDNEALSDFYCLDTVSWTWTSTVCGGDTPSARHSHSLAAVGNKLFLFGGREGNRVYGDLYVLDLESLRWSQVKAGGKPPSPRFSHTMTVVGDYHVAVIGGCPITKDKDLILLDTSSLTWVRLQVDWAGESLLVRHTSVFLGDRLVTVGGGAACFAFGTYFSPPLKLELKPFLQNQSCTDLKQRGGYDADMERPFSAIKSPSSDGDGLSWVFKVDTFRAKQAKDALKTLGWLETTRKSKVLDQRACIAFPILESAAAFLSTQSNSHPLAGSVKFEKLVEEQVVKTLLDCRGEVLRIEMPGPSKQCSSPFATMKEAVATFLKQNGLSLSFLQELPHKWERLGNLVVFPAGSFMTKPWSSLGEELWRVIAVALSAGRLARQAPVAATGTRDSQLQLLYGEDGWVEHKENGIIYCFDATKCMFSSGNVSEKLRVAKMDCRGATVVDLFAGIGYYLLPFLVKAGARHVYACEWNPHAVQALRHNLRVNGVEELCTVLEGDNKATAPEGIADIVSLGLLPSSETSWPTAVSALRPQGGLLLVHANVKDSEEEDWRQYLLASVSRIASAVGRAWDVDIVHLERVKWYAPHIRHVVADVLCKQSVS